MTYSEAALPANADLNQEVVDQQLEKHVQVLTEEFRCLVCQNQSIADSHAELAIMLKNQIREQLTSGMSDQQVVDFMVQRYGDFVLYRPPVKSTTWILWFGPFLLLLSGLIFLANKLRQLHSQENVVALPDEFNTDIISNITTRLDTKAQTSDKGISS